MRPMSAADTPEIPTASCKQAAAEFFEMRFAVKRIANQWWQEQLGQKIAGRAEIESDQLHARNDQPAILRVPA
jgi:hypothetical protein